MPPYLGSPTVAYCAETAPPINRPEPLGLGGFRVLGFRVFRVLRFRGLGFRVWVLGVLGV